MRRLPAAVALLAAAGCGPLPLEPVRVSEGGQGAYEVDLAVGPAGVVAAWYDTRDGNPEIYLRALDDAGRPVGQERRLTDDTELSYEPDVAWLGEAVAVAWYGRTGERHQARVGRWALDGTVRWTRILRGDGGDSRNPAIVAYEGRLFCAWIETTASGAVAVWTQWLDGTGEPLGTPVRVAPAGDTTWHVNAAVDPGGAPWVVFDAAVGTGAPELFLVRGEAPRRLVRLTEDDGVASRYPDLAFADDRVVLTWFDERDGNREVYLLTMPQAALGTGGAMPSLRVTHTPGESLGAYLAWDGRRVGLAWSDRLDETHDILFQAFSPGGTPLDPARRLTRTSTASLIPSIAAVDGAFLLAWNEDVVAERGDHAAGGRSHVAAVRVE